MELVYNETSYEFEETDTSAEICVSLIDIDEIVAGITIMANVDEIRDTSTGAFASNGETCHFILYYIHNYIYI